MKMPDTAWKDRRAVLFVFLASVCFSTGGLFIKLIPWSALAINGARNLIGAAVIGLYLLLSRHRLVFSRRVFVGALSMIGVTTLFAVANKLTTAANTIVLQFTAPVFVILFMALIGIIIATIVNIFLKSSGLEMIVSYLGVLIFVGLTAYDSQKIKNMLQMAPDASEGSQKLALLGALTLYLDFINLFIYLLRIFGRRE